METALISQDMDGDKLYQQRAREALPLLVRQAEAGQPVFYSELAREMGMSNPRNLNYVLGSVGTTLVKLSKQWDEDIPAIQSLVLNMQTGLPGEGIAEFLNMTTAQYGKLPKKQRQAIVNGILDKVFAYHKWRDVLNALGLPAWKVTPLSDDLYEASNLGAGESERHKKFKEYVASQPELFGLPHSAGHGMTEYALPSGDFVDVAFSHESEWVIAEVKSAISPVADIVRGLFQCVKYKAVLKALLDVKGVLETVRVVLVLESVFPTKLLAIKNTLGVEIIENIKAV